MSSLSYESADPTLVNAEEFTRLAGERCLQAIARKINYAMPDGQRVVLWNVPDRIREPENAAILDYITEKLEKSGYMVEKLDYDTWFTSTKTAQVKITWKCAPKPKDEPVVAVVCGGVLALEKE